MHSAGHDTVCSCNTSSMRACDMVAVLCSGLPGSYEPSLPHILLRDFSHDGCPLHEAQAH